MQFSRLLCGIMVCLFLLAAYPGLAEQGVPKLELAAPFTNNMILQRPVDRARLGMGQAG